MGTTMVAATLLEDHLCVANVGDSRLYVYRDGQLSQITQDHSVVGEMVRKGEMPKEEARSHPKRTSDHKSSWCGGRGSMLISLMRPCRLEIWYLCVRMD